jgi:DNA (cytosine-5)-methyltransferase 1
MAMKPPYRVPSMAEIREIPWNGLRVVSTFSGCGGSCLGWRMAGYKVVWASEFIPKAQETYRANHDSHLDTRDIRDVTPEEILASVGVGVGDIDVFDGSPPCSSFSPAGNGASGWGSVKKYSDSKQRTDDLFDEYVRLVDGLRPRVFVAENVPRLSEGKAVGYFQEVAGKLSGLGYTVRSSVLDAQWLGVPQARRRLFIIGVRDDLGVPPVFPAPLPYRYTVADVLPWVVPSTRWEDFPDAPTQEERDLMDIRPFAIYSEWQKLRPGERSKRYFQLGKLDPRRPHPTICATFTVCAGTNAHPFEPRKLTVREAVRVSGFPLDFVFPPDAKDAYERIGRAVPPLVTAAIARSLASGVFGVHSD